MIVLKSMATSTSIPHATPSPSISTAGGGISASGSSSSNALTSPVKEHPASHTILSPSTLSQEGNAPQQAEPKVEAQDPMAEAGKAIAAEADMDDA
jgi:hypothetical protein